MNAPMLIDAGQMTDGAPGVMLMRRGLTHLLTLARDLVRADGSTVHRMAYDARTGRRIGPLPGQGLSTRSTWARGQAWAINGFTQGLALTHDPRLLEAARRTADYWLAHVPDGCAPAWDLDVTSAAAPRDSSALAIAADGLQSLAGLDPDAARAARYRASAQAAWAALSAAEFVPEQARGVLQRQAYDIPAVAREGTYAWGDAYLLEGLLGAG
jgi:unsaturated chondroitin disaccharide hydrolase